MLGEFSWGGWWLRSLAMLLLALGCVPGGAKAQAAADIPGQIALSICIAPMASSAGKSAIAAIPSGFDCSVKQARLGPGDFWIRLARPDGTDLPSGHQLQLTIDWQQAMTVYVRRSDGSVWSQRLDSARVGAFTQIGPAVVIPLPAGQSPVADIVIAVEGAGNIGGVIGEAALVTAAMAQTSERNETALFAGFIGLVGGLLVFNLVLWATLRERFQIFYCAMAASMLVYAISHSAAINILLPGFDANDRFRLGYVTLAFATSSGLLFAINFFEPAVIPRWVRHASAATIVAIIGSAVGFAALAPQHLTLLDRLFLFSFIPAPLLLLTIFGYALGRKSPYASLFVLAWSAPVLMIIMRILHAAQIIDVGFVMDHGTLLAMACESLLSSLAMSFRIKMMRRERDVARGEEISARRLAEVDAQTGLFNRRALLARALESRGPQALLVIDIDHFKRINDSVGHDVGDEVLNAVARVIADQAGPAALVARLGGEEFAVLMPTAAVPERFAETIIRAMGVAPMPHGERVTVSIGTATGEIAHEGDWRTLYRSADQALYQAKNSGRDTVRHSWPTIAALAAA